MKTIETTSLVDLCASLQLEMSCSAAFRTKDDTGWEHNAYTVTLCQAGRGYKDAIYSGPFKMGTGIKYSPKLVDVMHGLLMDAQGANQSFEHWCADYGYSDDSIKALDIYHECQKTRDKLAKAFDSVTLEKLFEAASEY